MEACAGTGGNGNSRPNGKACRRAGKTSPAARWGWAAQAAAGQSPAAGCGWTKTGNLIQKSEGSSTTHYGYDSDNRLIEVKDQAGNLIARYGYDPHNRRTWKEQYRDRGGKLLTQAQRTYYLYADEGLIAEATQPITLNADGSVTATQAPTIATQYGPKPGSEFTTGTLFVKTRDSNGQDSIAYYHHNHLQTPLQATDKAGNVIWAASYEPFGQASIITPGPTAQQPTITSNLRLPGQYEDSETGLHYNWNRYYDPQTGRYVTADPIGLEGGINLFAYVGGNPLWHIDPEGLAPYDQDGWTDAQGGQINGLTNCYGYALDRMGAGNPGGSSLFPLTTCRNLISNAKSDGLVEPLPSGACGGSCPSGYHKIQIFLDDKEIIDRDYHVYREDDDGGWSHKLGRAGRPIRVDGIGKPIKCPMASNRKFGNRSYDSYCGTLCAPETGLTRNLQDQVKK